MAIYNNLPKVAYIDRLGFLSSELGEEYKNKSILNESANKFVIEKLAQKQSLLNIEEKYDAISY